MNPIIGGPSAGHTTDATASSIVLPDPRPTLADPHACEDFAALKTVYTRRLFGVTDFNGERVVLPLYAPENWSDERVFTDLLISYHKAHT